MNQAAAGGQFLVRYFDAGKAAVVEEQVLGASVQSVREQWSAGAHVVLSVTQVRLARASTAPASERSLKFDVAWWCRELKTLLLAGMTVVEAVETLHAQSGGTQRDQVHAGLLRGLQEGQALSKAMLSCEVFPAVLVASITASERTSTLTTALDDYLRYDELLAKLRKQAVSAAIYPGIVMSLGALITLFLLVYVIPRFSRMYGDFRGTMSTTTQVLLWVSRVLNEHALLLCFALASAVALLAWAWQRQRVMPWVELVVERVNFLRQQWDHFRFAKLYQSLALMFRGGYTLDEALAVCERLQLGTRLTAGLAVARGELAKGRAVSQAFAQAGLTEVVSARLLAVGERTGGFDAVLQTVADRHAQAFVTFVERATRIIEPLLLLTVALVVGGIVVMMYMPIFDMANGVR